MSYCKKINLFTPLWTFATRRWWRAGWW